MPDHRAECVSAPPAKLQLSKRCLLKSDLLQLEVYDLIQLTRTGLVFSALLYFQDVI